MMKRTLKPLIALVALLLTASTFGQSNGLLTFSFTQTAHSAYTGNKNVMAVWIQTSSGAFIKTRTRNVGNGTKDHLPTWAVNSGGSANNALGSGCNVVNATTGATYTSFTTRTVTWDGTDAAGTLVPDGVYQITIQSTWNHGTSGSTSRSFTFTKGPNDDILAPADDANFTGISLQWIASAAELNENFAGTGVKVYPNPSQDGMFTVEYANATSLSVYDIMGKEVNSENLETESGTVSLNLSELTNGFYFLHVSDGVKTSEHKLVINQ